MIPYLGDFSTGATVYIPFQTFDSNDPSASVTITGLAVTDIEVYKNGSITQRASDNGYTLLDTDGIDFDGITGIHGFSIDLSDNSDAGFYAAGNDYFVVVSSITVDAATINFVAAQFSIENRSHVTPLSDIESSLVIVKSDLVVVESNTVVIESDSIVVESSVQAIEAWGNPSSDLAAIESELIVVHSETTVVQSQTTVIESDSIIVESSVQAIEAWGNPSSDLAAIESELILVHSETTVIQSDTVVIESSVQVVESDTAVIESDTTLLERGVILADGTADSGSTTTMVDAARTEAATDYWKGDFIVFTSGTIAGQVREITAFTPATDTITFEPATTAAVGTNTYVIIPGIRAETIRSDLTAIESSVAVVESQTTVIESNTIVIESDTIVIESSVQAIEAWGDPSSDLAAIESELILVHSETTVIQSDTTVIEAWGNPSSDLAAIESELILVHSETTVIQSDTTVLEAGVDVTSISGSTPAADNLEAATLGIVASDAKAGTLSTTQMSTNLSEATDDHYIGRTVIWTSGVLAGQASDVTDYTGVNGVLTFTAVTEAPGAGDTFVLV